MGKITIKITELKGKNAKITCECMPFLALEIINKIAEDHEVEVYVNAKKMSMASIIALKNADFKIAHLVGSKGEILATRDWD